MKNKYVPDIRFAEFTPDWNSRLLGDLIEISSASRVHKNEWTTSGVRFFRSSDIVANYMGKKNTPAFISKELYKSLSERSGILQPGDLLITGGGSIGIPYLVIDKEPLYFKDADLLWLKSANKVDGHFLYYYFLTPQLRKHISSVTHIGTISHYTIEQAKVTPITLPNLAEQIKIGDFFEKLDQNISLHQQELATLKQTKQGFLQKMFPKEGASVPEIRFSDFTEEWQLTNIGSIADVVRGASPRPIQDPRWFDKKSEVGWLRIADVTKQNGRIHYLEQRISKAGQEKTRVLNKPHLLLSIAATVGKPVVNYVKTGVHDGFLIFLNPKFELEFMFQWLEMFRPKWQKYGQPGSQVNLNSELVRNQEVHLPSLEEQKKISEFFMKMDSNIVLYQKELDALQQTKKAFLQKMFI